MTSSKQDFHPEGPVGFFWDYDSIPSLEEQELIILIRKIDEFGEMLGGGRGFDTKVLCHHSPKNTEYFRKFGFEVIDQDGDSWPALDSGVLSVAAKILLWLWDLERATISGDPSEDGDTCSSLSASKKAPVVFLVTANDHNAPLLTNLKQRGITVVCVSTFSGCTASALHRACSCPIDFKQFIAQDTAAAAAVASTVRGGSAISKNMQNSDLPPSEEGGGSGVENDKPPPGLLLVSSTSTSSSDESKPVKERDHSPSPTSTQWSPTPREDLDSPRSPPRLAVPPLALGSCNQVEDMLTYQQHSRSQVHQCRSLPLQALPSALGGGSEEDMYVHSARSLDSGGYLTSALADHDHDQDADSALLMEQRLLHDELVSAIYMNNVKAAVATLRKMYTRQSRSFRIPALLALIMPDTAAMLEDNQVELFHVSVKFSLDCIQWCFGIQRGENIDSFKYKMNKNIARWMLKETQRKGLPSPASQYTINIAVALIKIILVDTTELEFALEILTCLNVPQPLQHFVPFVTSWMKASPSYQQQHLDLQALKKFVYEHPELHTFMQRGGSPLPSPRDRMHSGSSVGSAGSYLSHQKSYGGVADMGKSPPDNREEQWIRDSSNSLQQGAREHMLYNLNEFGENASNMFGGGKPGRDVERQGVSGPGLNSNPNSQPLEAKLLKLLMRSTKGELGARIPALYRDEYGEPLRLRGRKLKDILLETGLVEMVGSDGPGDKLFRIIGNPHGAHSPHDSGGSGMGQTKEIPRLRPNESGMMGTGNHPLRGNHPQLNARQRSYQHSLSSASNSSTSSFNDSRHDSFGASLLMHTVDRNDRGAGDAHHRPVVPSLLNDEYPGGLNDLLKNRDGGDIYGSGHGQHSSSTRHHGHNDYSAIATSRSLQRPGGSVGQRQSPRQEEVYPSRQQQQHQQQYLNDMHDNKLYGVYNSDNRSNSSRRDEFNTGSGTASHSLRDGYLSRKYEDHNNQQSQSQGQVQSSSSSSSYLFESGGAPFDLTGGGSGSGSPISELNLDSKVLGGAYKTAVNEGGRE